MAEKPFVSPRRLKRFFTGLLGEKLNTKEEILANTDVKKFAGAMAVQEMFNDVNNSLVNENSESFNFGVKDGVRGFFTNPSRADDSFIPFSSVVAGSQQASDKKITINYPYNKISYAMFCYNSNNGCRFVIYNSDFSSKIYHISVSLATVTTFDLSTFITLDGNGNLIFDSTSTSVNGYDIYYVIVP